MPERHLTYTSMAEGSWLMDMCGWSRTSTICPQAISPSAMDEIFCYDRRGALAAAGFGQLRRASEQLGDKRSFSQQALSWIKAEKACMMFRLAEPSEHLAVQSYSL